MKSLQTTSFAIYSQSVVGILVSLLIESGRQVEEMTSAVRSAVAASDTDDPEPAQRIIIEAGARLRSVKLLLDKVDDWAIEDPIGSIGDQARSVKELCAAADVELERAAGFCDLSRMH